MTAPSSQPATVSAIIVNWNTRDLLALCLRTLEGAQSSAGETIEIVVVDNASTDGSTAMLRSEFPGVRLIANGENEGFARANNRGMAACRGEFVLLLNPDTAVQPGALGTMLALLRREPQAGAVGPRLLNADGTLQPSCSPFPIPAGEAARLFHLDRFTPSSAYAMEEWPVDRARPVDVVQGACILVRRRVLEQVGLFDGGYFMYSEEVDLCKRIRAAGWSILWEPRAQVIHFGGGSSRQVATRMFLQLYRSRVLYFRKHLGRGAALRYKAVLAAAALSRVVFGSLARFDSNPQHIARDQTARNYLLLLRALPSL